MVPADQHWRGDAGGLQHHAPHGGLGWQRPAWALRPQEGCETPPFWPSAGASFVSVLPDVNVHVDSLKCLDVLLHTPEIKAMMGRVQSVLPVVNMHVNLLKCLAVIVEKPEVKTMTGLVQAVLPALMSGMCLGHRCPVG